MANVDSLDIQISASAKEANKAIGTLISNLGTLSNQLGKLNGSSFANFANGMKTLADGMKAFQDIKLPDFTRVAKGIEKFGNIDANKISSIGNALQPLATGISTLSSTNFDNKNLQNLINSLTRLGNSNLSSLQNVDFTALGNSIKNLANSLSGASKVEQSTISITNAVANLAKSGTNIQAVAVALPLLSTNLKDFINTMSTASTVAPETITFTQALGLLANAGNKVGITATQLPQLSNALKAFFQTMSQAPTVSKNTIQMTNALAKLASQGSKVGTASNSMVSGLTRTSSAMAKTTKKAKSLASAIGKFYATWFLAIRGIKSLWKSVESSMDYIETLNYFNAAFGQVAEKANLSSWKELGYDSAEAYYNSFAERAEQVTQKMTGFTVSDNGMIMNTGQKSLGLNPSEVMNYQAMFGQMASSMGVTSETATKMSQALTEIGADLASVKNLDFNKVWTDMASGLAGRERLVA